MAIVCNLIPLTKKGEESQLYKELLRYTSNNRKLTNFLYATAIQKEFMDKCKPSELNAQREPSTNKVITTLHVDSMIDTADKIKAAHTELGTMISSTPVKFDDINSILDKVIEFNDRENNPLRAVIKYKEGTYVVDIDVLNDLNFAENTGYIAGKLQVKVITDAFTSMGLNISGWNKLSNRALNAYNARFFIEDSFLKFRNLNTTSNKISLELASLLLDLFKDSSEVLRLISIFHEKAPLAFMFLFNKGTLTTIPSELDSFDDLLFNPGGGPTTAQRMVDSLKKVIENKFKRVDYKVLLENINALYKNTITEENTAIRETLKVLYKKFHLDKDTLAIDIKKISSTEELLKVMLILMNNTLNVLKKREILTADSEAEYKEKIAEIENKINKKLYALSITQFMLEVVDVLKDTIEIDKDSELSMLELNNLASLFLDLLEKINSYLPVIQKLLNKELLADLLEAVDIETISTEAKRLKNHLLELNESLQEKKFAFAYNYIHRFWGDDSHYQGLGLVDRVLEDAMNMGTVDMNVFDRYLLSATEVHDSVLSTVAESIKSMHLERDEKMQEIDYLIRVATEKLYLSGSDTSFMYETSKNGTLRIISDIDWDKYYEELKKHKEFLKSKGLKGTRLENAIKKWEDEHNSFYVLPFTDSGEPIKLDRIPIFRKAMPTLSAALLEYYTTMLKMKYDMEVDLESYGIKTFLFRPVQMPKSIEEAVQNMTPAEVFTAMKNKFLDWKTPNSEYGIIEEVFDATGERVNSIPVFYIDKLEDQTSVSRNFSKAMMSFMAMGINHNLVSNRASILEVTKSFLLDRPVETSVAGKPIVQSVEALGLRMNTTARVKSSETPIKGWVEDLYEAKFYGKRHKLEDEKIEKGVKALVQYTSVTGLAMNIPGALANIMVGKLLMIIEAGGNEFANFKDYGVAEGQYWLMLKEVLGELTSNNKKSKLALLMDKFDALDDFYDKLREAGFYKSPLSKIIGNTSLFFLYGLGEHLLHGLNMLAVLNHIKVKSPEGKMCTLLDAFEVLTEENNGKLVLKEGYTYKYKANKDAPEEWKPVNDAFVLQAKKKIGYVNRSCNGAFGADEKGAIHRYAFGRLIMNFRQWMPAHYARRFNTLHWDADLGDYREGYYVTTWKFASSLAKDILNHEFELKTRWNSLTDMEKANLQRALTESLILITLVVLTRMFGSGDDKKHRNWFEAMALYQLLRCKLETGASTPLYATGFLLNIFTIVNSPAASINTLKNLTPLLSIDELITGEKYEAGKYKGEYKYLHKVERAVPFYGQVKKWWNMDIDDSIFGTFKN